MMAAFGESFVAPLKLSARVSGMTREFPTVFRSDPHRLSCEAGLAWGRAAGPGRVSAQTSAGGAGLQDPHGVPSLQGGVVCSPTLLCHIDLHKLLTRVCKLPSENAETFANIRRYNQSLVLVDWERWSPDRFTYSPPGLGPTYV